MRLIVHSSFRLRNSSLTGYLVIVLGVGLDRAADTGARAVGKRAALGHGV